MKSNLTSDISGIDSTLSASKCLDYRVRRDAPDAIKYIAFSDLQKDLFLSL
jgi:hypothetical protein